VERVHSTDKIARYKWVCLDKPGALVMLDKLSLKIDDSYQRDLNVAKTLEISSQWSWIACGALIVAKRAEEFLVIDGQHRLAAALKRSDIKELPCIVFETEGVKEEAVGFLRSNTNRRPIGAIARHKAAIAAEDPVAQMVHKEIVAAGLEVSTTASRAPQIKCITICTVFARQDMLAFRNVIRVAARLSISAGIAVHEKLISGLWHIHMNIEGGLNDGRISKRIFDVGALRLIEGAKRAGAFYTRGGPKVFAEGMLQEINKGLHNKFQFIQKEPADACAVKLIR
jgi:hypothetical protein